MQLKNRLIKAAVRLGQLLTQKNQKRNHFLIVSTTALGDTLWATPAIESIRTRFPHCYIGVLTSTVGAEVLKHNPHIDKVFLLKGALFSLWKELYKEQFDTVLLFHASQRLTLPLCSLLGARQIVGTAGINKGLDSLLTHPLPNQAQHEIVRRLKIGEAVGVMPTTETLSFFLSEEEKIPPRSGHPWIALHPGSNDLFKRWPKEKFIELGQMLHSALKCKILITGIEQERALMEEVHAQIPGSFIDEPKRSLRQFAALLKEMDLIISNDTGPVHLACALNRPVIAIYASTDPALCGPHKAKRASTIFRRSPCDPCLKRKCRLPFCFLQIGTKEVFDQAIAMLNEKVEDAKES